MQYFKRLLRCENFELALLLSRSTLMSTKKYSSVKAPIEVKIPTPWGHIAGKEWGPKNGHPVIAVHGWQDNAASFDTLIPLLKNDLHIYALDLPGHGMSSHIPQGMIYSPMVYVNAIHRAVEYLKLKRFYCMGHSLGAEACYYYASTYPEKVSHFIALDSFKPINVYINDIAGHVRKAMEYYLKLENSQSSPPQYTRNELMDKISSILNNAITRKSAEVLFTRSATKCSNNKYTFNRDPRLRLDAPWFGMSDNVTMAYGSQMRCHVLFVKAKPGTDFEPPEVERCSVDVLRNCLPSLRYEEVPGSHFVHLNSPEIVAPLINEVLEL